VGWQEGATFGTAALYPSAGPVGLGPSVTVNVPAADVVSIPNFLNPATGLFGLTGTTVSYYNSYEISLFLSNGAGTLGIALVTVFWFAQATDANPVYESSWYCQANGGGVLTVGSGPQRGNIMAITVQNLDVVGVVTVNLEITGSQRAISNDNWQSNGVQVTQTATNARPFTNELLVTTAATIAGSGATLTRGCFLYAGKAHLHIANLAAAGTFVGTLQDSVFQQAVIWSQGIPEIGTGPIDIDLILPHLPMQLIVVNTGAAAGTLTASLIADRV
jgi:hypothetical protein